MLHPSLVQSLIGGVLIGIASSALLLGSGQVAGISGALGNAVMGRGGAGRWRLLFLLGLAVVPPLYLLWSGHRGTGELHLSAPLLVAAGLLVGFGTRRAAGCTSGHGVCGLGNLSLRSLVAVAIFMGVAATTVFVVRHVIGA